MSGTLNDQHQRQVAPDLAIGTLVRPRTAEELGDLLRECTAASKSVLPFGGGGSIHTGRVVPGFDIGIDMRSLRGVIDYQPDDLTLSVRAGTTMSEIAAVLVEKGQELPIDVPFPNVTTIGGLAATGFAGPRK
ncbi:MAG: FAD-binding oxidoreductase, partial [Chloroflexota bacterium]|nr:FAD-binding oxidoreductase [Chloroflexota bacterium]